MIKTKESTVTYLCFLSVCVLQLGHVLSDEDKNVELFLTPMIEKGELDKARNAARANTDVKMTSTKEGHKEIEDYSGYFTIETLGHNIFFWFFPALNGGDNSPLIIWIPHLPGWSSMASLFTETGPFYLDQDDQLRAREFTWTTKYSVLYLDVPVNSGFSFTKNGSKPAANSDEEADEILEVISQFFKLFPTFKNRDLYIAGEVFAGITIPHIILKIDSMSSEARQKMGLNFRGMILGSPMINMHIQDNRVHTEYFYGLGLFDESQRDEMQKNEDELVTLNNPNDGDKLIQIVGRGWLFPGNLFSTATGFDNTLNMLSSKQSPALTEFAKYVDSEKIHQHLHVGLHKFINVNPGTLRPFLREVVVSNSTLIEEVLNKGYRVLIYAAQFDGLVPYNGITKLVKSFKWNGAKEFNEMKRKIWKVDDEVAGLVKQNKNFYFVFLRNAGNRAAMDQPQWTLDMIDRFISQKGF